MILVDTSVWIDHFRRRNQDLIDALEAGEVLGHPFIRGELACGTLRNRQEILSLLRDLPQAIVADQDEVLHLIEEHHLMGRGLGYIDAHLLASALLGRAGIWTRDKPLTVAAEAMELRAPMR